MIPQIAEEFTNNITQVQQTDLTYRLGSKTVSGKIDKIDSIKQAICHILSTERYSNPIYDDDYGVELEQYVGKDLGFISASIENELREALCQDDRISDVQVNNISKGEQENSCLVEFTVFTKYGNIEEELNVLQ